MSQEFVISLARDALFNAIIISSPVLGLSLVVGLVISILQTTTSIQEQTLTFVPKIIAIFFAIILFGPFMLRKLMDFTIRIFEYIPYMVR